MKIIVACVALAFALAFSGCRSCDDCNDCEDCRVGDAAFPSWNAWWK